VGYASWSCSLTPERCDREVARCLCGFAIKRTGWDLGQRLGTLGTRELRSEQRGIYCKRVVPFVSRLEEEQLG
jgi:hypothetical protein